MSMKKVEVVIAKYKEDTSWTLGLTHPYIIYDKSDDPIFYSIRLPNIGREAHTYLYHIVKNYHNLADTTIFLQGNPWDHADVSVEQGILEMNHMNGNESLSTFFKGGQFDLDTAHYRFIVKAKIFKNDICISSDPITYPVFSAGAQYIVPKNCIHARPLKAWEKLLRMSETNRFFDDTDGKLDPWAFERMWPLLFMPDNELHPTFLE